jgi:cathepsin C
LKKYKTSSEIPDDEIPDNFDWRNVGGYDFISSVLDQGACGSCYANAYSLVVKNRLQVKYGKSIPNLSTQQMMTCNYLTEGCEGGFSQLLGYFFKNAYMVSEECAPYTGNTKGAHCGDYSHCEPIAKIKS